MRTVTCKGADGKLLRKREVQLELKIEKLLDLVERGGDLPLVRERIEQRQRELDRVRVDLKRMAQNGRRPVMITEQWVMEKLAGLAGLVQSVPERVSSLRNELRRVFPQKLSVMPSPVEGGVQFTIGGDAHPFGIVPRNELQLCIIAVQGLEPRTRGL